MKHPNLFKFNSASANFMYFNAQFALHTTVWSMYPALALLTFVVKAEIPSCPVFVVQTRCCGKIKAEVPPLV